MSTTPVQAVLADPDQWVRCAHEHTALLDGGGVQLTWTEPRADSSGLLPDAAACPAPGGLTFDRWCRAYRSWPEVGCVQSSTEGRPAPDGSGLAGLREPSALAVDDAQRLYIVESGSGVVHVIDLWAQRLLRKVPIGVGDQRAVDCATRCCEALVLLNHPAALATLRGRADPRPGPALRRPRCASGMVPRRVTAAGDDVLVLWSAPCAGDGVVAALSGAVAMVVRGATDLLLVSENVLVIAYGPGLAFGRRRRAGSGWVELEPLAAPGYDGGAVTVGRDGQVAYTTAQGWAWTAGSAARHVEVGRVVSYRLDGGDYGRRWGRLFIDACLASGTSLEVGCVTSDDDTVVDPVPAGAPDRGSFPVPNPEDTPPLPPRSLLALAEVRSLYRRREGREWPWAQILADDGYETYEAPVIAPPGRYLWLVLSLTGTARVSPRVRSLRVEIRGHPLLSQLPGRFSRTEPEADFLHRFLAPAYGLLNDLDARAAMRAVLVDPANTPSEALEWLGGFVGLVLDRRWPEQARRQLVAEAVELFRIRGTAASLEALVSMYLGRKVSIVDNWQLRGLTGGLLGPGPSSPVAPAIAATSSASSQLGHFTLGALQPAAADADDSVDSAHRFTVLVPRVLDPERRTVVHDILEVHKPAHTDMEVCEFDGMRVGRASRVRLTTVVGRGSHWGPATVGQVALGTDGVVGTPAAGWRVGGALRCEGLRVG